MQQSMQMRASQQLAMTPQVQLAIQLLQLSKQDFDEKVARALMETPFLEQDEEHAPASSPMSPAATPVPTGQAASSSQDPVETTGLHDDAQARETDSDGWYHASAPIHDDDDCGPLSRICSQPTLRDHLLLQVHASHLSERDQALAGVVVDALDDTGYLLQSTAVICAMLPDELQVRSDELGVALSFVQSLDPA